MNIRLLYVSFACLALLFMTVSDIDAEEGVKTSATAELDQLLLKMAESDGFSCRFNQLVFFAEGGVQRYSGTLAIRKPGRFRWEYTLPYEQLYISSGSVVWHYEADLMQAERMKNLDAVDPVAMKLLDGRIGIKDIKLLATENLGAGNVSYRIKIDNGPELVLAFLAAGELHWLESEDMLGNRNRIILLDMIQKTLPDGLFLFIPPEGVEVVDIAGADDGSEQGY
ncbi:MAG: outer-membrane lipoprotein carrier protein LolA [Mariprofundaceae bacterium]